MARKGYRGEWLAKRKLGIKYGKQNVIKVAIGGAQDFIVLSKGRIIKFIEVKECHKKKFYPSPREKDQFSRIENLAKEHNAAFEVWVKYPYKEFKIDKII